MDLRHNPFYILGASMTDNKRRIMELAEEKSLFGEEEAVEEAKTILLDPIRRIDAELSWFPELDGRSAQALAEWLIDKKNYIEVEINGLSRINETTETISDPGISEYMGEEDFANELLELAHGFRDLDITGLLYEINQRRTQSGFPEITDEYLFSDKIDNRRSEVMSVIQHCIESMLVDTLLKSFYLIAYRDTDGGKIQASILVEDIVRFYENNMSTQEFMENETTAIQGVLDSIRHSANDKAQSLSYAMNLVKALSGELQKWQKVVAPVQIVALSHGKEHTLSARLLHEVRSVAIDLNNDYDSPELALELLNSIEQSKADKYIPSFHEVKNKDRASLNKILSDRQEEKKAEQEYESSIFYEAKIGLIFTDTFQLSSKGITWNNKFYKLLDITRIRWGVFRSVKKNVFGGVISEHTEYTVCFGTNGDCIVFHPDASQYNAITDRLWKAVGSTILFNYINRLKSGKSIIIKNAAIYDNGVELEKHNYFSANERKFFAWKDISVANGNGYFSIKSRNSNDFMVALYYIDDDNTHVVETMIRSLFKNYNKNNPRISSLINSNNSERKNPIHVKSKKEDDSDKKKKDQRLQEANSFNDKGVQYHIEGNYKFAIDCYTKSIEINPNDIVVYKNRGNAYFALNDYSNALKDYLKSIEINPLDAIAHCCCANTYYQLSDYESAISEYTESININPRNSSAYRGRGNVFAAQNKSNQAILDYTKAIENDSEEFAAYVSRGDVFYGLKQYTNAIQDCSKAIEIKNDCAKAYTLRGASFYELRDYVSAINNYNKTLEFEPNNADAYLFRGNAFLALKEYVSAINDYTKSLEIEPHSIFPYRGRGNTFLAMGNVSRAISDYTRALEINPQSADIYFLRGNAYKLLGDELHAGLDYEQARNLKNQL